jgi:hypothetical protein
MVAMSSHANVLSVSFNWCRFFPEPVSYVGVKEELNYSAAQDYCSNGFKNAIGSLAGFQSDSEWKNISDLITTIENVGENECEVADVSATKKSTGQESTRKYWTGLECQDKTGHCSLSNGINASFDRNITKDGECFALQNGCRLTPSNCSEENYFICKITKFISEGITLYYIFNPTMQYFNGPFPFQTNV